MNEEEKKANCFTSVRDEKGFPLKGKLVARSGIPLSPSPPKRISAPSEGADIRFFGDEVGFEGYFKKRTISLFENPGSGEVRQKSDGGGPCFS
jgi:hypothetical protein